MQDLPGEALHSGPVWNVRKVREAGRYDGDRRLPRFAIRFGSPEGTLARERADGRVEDGREAEGPRIGFQIAYDLSARRIAPVSHGHGKARQAGPGAVGVQMQTVVVAPPDRSDRIGLFEDHRIEAARLQAGRSGKPGRPRANHDCVAAMRHAPPSAIVYFRSPTCF